MIEIKINGETVTSKVIPRNPEELQADFLRVLLVLRHVIEKAHWSQPCECDDGTVMRCSI